MPSLNVAAENALTAVQVARKEQFLSPLHSSLYRAVALHFEEQSDALAVVLYRRGFTIAEAPGLSLSAVIDEILYEIFLDFATDLTTVMSRTIVSAMEGAIRHRLGDFVLEGVKHAISFDLSNPLAQSYLKKYAADQVTRIDETTRRSIKYTIQSGEKQGKSYTEIAREIKAKFAEFGEAVPQKHLRNRAELVTVYELGQAYETGGNQAAAELLRAGYPVEKKALTVHDDRVDQECIDNEAEGWITFLKPHKSGHQHPNFHIACRCCELYRIDQAALRASLLKGVVKTTA